MDPAGDFRRQRKSGLVARRGVFESRVRLMRRQGR